MYIMLENQDKKQENWTEYFWQIFCSYEELCDSVRLCVSSLYWTLKISYTTGGELSMAYAVEWQMDVAKGPPYSTLFIALTVM